MLKYSSGIVVVGIIVWLAWSSFHAHGSSPLEQEEVNASGSQFSLSSIETSQLSGTQRRVLELVQQEYDKQPSGYDETVLTYTEGFEESWCADFISWLFDRADTPFIHPDTGYWRIPGVLTLQSYYRQYDAYYEVGQYAPEFGDVASYFGETPDGDSTEHVAMVLAVDGDTFTTIGGNETDQGVVQIRTERPKEGVKGLAGFGASHL